MKRHQKLLENKYPHAKEDFCYNTGGGIIWSLFRTQSDGVTIYYHETDEFHIISGNKAQFYSLAEIADSWNAHAQKLEL